MKTKNSLLAATAGIFLLGSAVPVPAQVWGSRNRPMEGRRYETMRALAHYLDETSQSALQTAMEDARRGAQGRRVLPLVRDFARRADDFHRMLDNYETRRVDIPPRVNDLIGRARNITGRLETTYVTGSTRAEWNDVVDVLDRMKRLMAGENVDVPMAHGGFEDYDRDYGMFGGVRPTSDTGGSTYGWTGTRLSDFRRLARELDESALRAHQIAETNRVSNSMRHQEFLQGLRRFAERANDVRERADAGNVNRRDMGPIVNQLLQDVRETDRSLRDTRVFPQVWEQWARTIDVLNRMSELVRD
jgi:hypothetical protein